MSNNFESEDIENEENSIINELNQEDNEEKDKDNEIQIKCNNIIKYKNEDYQTNNIIKILFALEILKNNIICNICNNRMKLFNNKEFKDGLCWRCTKYKPKEHDKKVNIRSGSLLSEMSSDNPIIYFIIFETFILRNSINVTNINCR